MQVRCRRERFGLLPRFRCCRSVLPAARGQVTRGVCALRREVLLGFFSHMRRVPSLHIGPNVQSHLCSGLSQEGVTVSVTITAVEGNEGIIHCVIIEWQKPGLATHLPLMDPGHYLLDESSSPRPRLFFPCLPVLPLLISASFHLFSPSFVPPPPLPCLIVILLPPHSHFSRSTSTSLSCVPCPYVLHSPRSSVSSSRSPSEAERDVAEEDIPGGRCHQYCQSSAAPRGPLELVSDWNTPTHMKTCAPSHHIPSIQVHMVLISRKYLTRGSCLFHFKTNE